MKYRYSFKAFGHPNITSKHRNTFEITKEEEIGKEGDCLIGVKADYSLEKIRRIIKKSKKITIELKISNLKETMKATINKGFNDDTELVVRKTNFISERTFAINADKAAKDFSREFVERLKNYDAELTVNLISIK